MKYHEGKGHCHLVRQSSVKYSYEKENHKLIHAASAPAAISEIVESQLDNEVFTKDDVEEETKTKTNEKGTGDADEKTEAVVEEKEAVEKVPENAEKNETKRSAPAEEETKVPGKAEEGNVSKDAAEKSTMAGDVETLTEGLQTALHLEDSGEKDEVKDEGDVSALADNLEQGLSLKEEDREATGKNAERVGAAERVQPRLRAKGIHREDAFGRPEVVMGNHNAFAQQGQWIPSQPPTSSPNWHVPSQPQSQVLPPLSIFLRQPVKPSGQPSQSVVCPPGQSNPTHRMYNMYMGAAGTQMLGVSTPSMQQQYAQQNLYPNNTQFGQTGYPQNRLDIIGSGVPVNQPQAMNIPTQSTGNPKEDDWPPTPEAQNDDILDRSPVESEEPMALQMVTAMDIIGSPSSQSWDGSHAPSIASTSPAPSPYSSDVQQFSPAQLVPDVNGPWSPESNISSSGEPPSPCGSTVIKVTDNMTIGTVTVSPVAPHPFKRQRNDSSTDTAEARERISGIKKYLQNDTPDSSPTYLTQWMSPPQVPLYNPSLTPPYTPAPEVPSQSFTTPYSSPNQKLPAPCQASSAPLCTHHQRDTPPEGELEAFRKHLAGWSVENLLMTDDDLDTVLHVAICQTKVALSLAIIERFYDCKQKQCLNVTNKLLQTPLYLSVVSNLPILTQILINYGADLFIRNKHGNTPLHAAAWTGNTEAIKVREKRAIVLFNLKL
jgi:hypothetical protein